MTTIVLVEIKNFNVSINNEPFFEQHIEIKQESNERIVEKSRNNDYATGNLLDDSYHRNYYEFLGIDLTRQTNTIICRHIMGK